MTFYTCFTELYSRISSVIEDLQSRLKGIVSGVWEPHVMKTRYNVLLSVATANLHVGCLSSFRRALPTDGDKVAQLVKELQVHDACL